MKSTSTFPKLCMIIMAYFSQLFSALSYINKDNPCHIFIATVTSKKILYSFFKWFQKRAVFLYKPTFLSACSCPRRSFESHTLYLRHLVKML